MSYGVGFTCRNFSIIIIIRDAYYLSVLSYSDSERTRSSGSVSSSDDVLFTECSWRGFILYFSNILAIKIF